MPALKSFYPPSPKNVPSNLTAVSPEYQSRVVLLLLCIGFFFLIYFGLLFLSFAAILWAIFMPVYSGAAFFVWLVKIGLFCFGSLIFLFLVKGFFNKRTRSRSLHVEIFEDDQPRLFEFIDQLCTEIGAPFPRRVFVSFDVGASASLGSSLWSLFIPSGKDLHIGLGLVNVLNLTEFKAVLAHEFGHFSQKSMRIGGFAYVAQMLTRRMVIGEDVIDELLTRWSAAEPVVAWPAWIISGVLWLMSRMFFFMFLGLLVVQKSLNREMEFHADLVATSVTGSDAIVHALKRVTFADAMMMLTLEDLAMARENGMYTTDMFLQHKHAASRLRKRAKEPQLGNPPPLPADRAAKTDVFDPEDEEEQPVMWQDHPHNYQREDNVKEQYIRTDFDERSAWKLFADTKELKELVTYRMYRVLFRMRRRTRLTDTQEVQAAINAEHEELTYDPKYQGVYDNRDINPGELQPLMAEATKQPWTKEQLVSTYKALYTPKLGELIERHHAHIEEHKFLLDVETSDMHDDEEFSFRGQYYFVDQVVRWQGVVNHEIKQDLDALAAHDRTVFWVHYQMARHLGEARVQELVNRYHFHLGVQRIWSMLQQQRAPVDVVLMFLSRSQSGPLAQGDFFEIREILGKAHRVLKKALARASEMHLPALTNMTKGAPLQGYLLKKNLVDGLTKYDDFITMKWMRKFLKQFEEVHANSNRIHFKSLGSLLHYQEEIGTRCLAKWGVAS